MIFEKNHKQWENAHTFYDNYKRKPVASSKNATEDYFWKKKLLDTPNGNLLLKNNFFDSLHNSSKIYLAHITYNLEDILKSGYVYSSGGCLVGSVYCFPLTESKDGLRLHNLGAYIYDNEAPSASRNSDKNPDVILFEIDNVPSSKKLIGIDYLKLGNNHFHIYKSLEYLLSIKERQDLYNIVFKKINESVNYLSLANHYYHDNYKNIDYPKFLELYVKTIDNLPILGYLYFEVVTEYLMLFQDSPEAVKFHKLGEFYNKSYKDLIFGLFPTLSQNFKLSLFKPDFKTLCNYIEENKLFKNFNQEQMLQYICERLIYLSNVRLFNNIEALINWDYLHWDFDNIPEVVQPLAGQIIHRELRTFHRYPDFYFYFDQLKALEVWNYWNYMDIVVPFNGVIPKGEIGINPASTKCKYKVFSANVNNKNGDFFVEKGDEVDIKIAPKLVDFKMSFMRNKA